MSEKSSTRDSGSDATKTTSSEWESELESDNDNDDSVQMIHELPAVSGPQKQKCQLNTRVSRSSSRAGGKLPFKTTVTDASDKDSTVAEISRDIGPVILLFGSGPAIIKGKIYVTSAESGGMKLKRFNGKLFCPINFESFTDLLVEAVENSTEESQVGNSSPGSPAVDTLVKPDLVGDIKDLPVCTAGAKQ